MLAVALIVAIYGVIWQQAASKFEQHLLCLIDDVKKHDGDITYDDLKVQGFPFRLAANLKNPMMTKNKVTSTVVKVDGNIWIQTSIFNMTKVRYSTQGVTQLSSSLDQANTTTHKPSWLLTTSHIEGDMDLWHQGFNRAATVTLKDVHMTFGEIQATVEDIRLMNFQTQLPTHLKVQLTATNIAPNLKHQAPFSQKIDQLMLSMRFDLEAPAEITTSHHLLEALAHHGGTLEVEEARLQWGKLDVQGNGTLTLDTAKQPLASMHVKIQGLDLVLAQLVQLKHIDPYIPSLAQTVLLPFKVASQKADASPQYNIPISLQEGRVSVASFPLLNIPKIDWSSLMSSTSPIESPSVRTTTSKFVNIP